MKPFNARASYVYPAFIREVPMSFNPFRVFQTRQPETESGYFNGQAIVDQAIHPEKAGRVRFRSSYWSARCDQPIAILPGEVVDVVGLDRITLKVEPAFMLKASEPGRDRIYHACQQRGWVKQMPAGIRVEETQPLAILVATGKKSAEIMEQTWQRFIQGKPIHIDSFKACCELLGLNWQDVVGYGGREAIAEIPETEIPESAAALRTDFVGRERAIAQLDQLVQSGAKAITILGEGGVGKTTLAQQYFSHAKFDLVLECWMSKENHLLTSAETVVQNWLRKHFSVEPGREFHASLERLRRRLQESKKEGEPIQIGILIDNIEPALDRQGQWVEELRGYGDLLEVLTDSTVQSVTLLTSREPLRHAAIVTQELPGLAEEAWRQFFSSRQIQTDDAFSQMHQAYNGNAKAMTILCSAIALDYNNSLAAYWQDHQANLLGEADLAHLVSSQFDRLQQLYPEAYRLLCRLGCYRYQDIASVPLEGLYSLLWDAPNLQRPTIVRFLRDLFLVEMRRGGYRLHPVIQTKAAALLKANQEWEVANRRAAEFWTNRVKTVETVEDAFTALEAYYHYIQIQDFEAAATVILQPRDNRWEKQQPLGVSFYRLGLLRRMIATIARVIDRVQPGYTLSKLHNILGDLYWLKGNIHQAIACHQKAQEVAIEFRLMDLEIVSIFNIGLCKIELGEIGEAQQFFNQVNSLADNTDCHMFAVGSWFCSAFIFSCLGQKQEALALARKVSDEYSVISSSAWSRGYSLLFLGMALKNLGDFDRATRMYELAKDYAVQSQFTQVEARALNGLGEICRERSDLEGAIGHHLAAQRLLARIEAKADLAEVYYQMGLTYGRQGAIGERQAAFQAAMRLFEQMGAPRQVEKVRLALGEV
jgi:tetratricopeptide (TPR) repeat protein